MLQVADYKTEVNKIAAKAGLNSRIPLWLHVVEQYALSAHPFWFMVNSATLSTVDGQPTYVLDQRCDGRRITKMNNESAETHVCMDNLANLLWRDPVPTDTGDPWAYAFQKLVRVQGITTAASVLRFASSDATDSSKKVVVRGLVSGVYRTEEIMLNAGDGTTPVNSSLTYDAGEVETVQKQSTFAGTLTVTAQSAAVTVSTIAPNDIAIEAPLIRFVNVPSAVQTMRYYFYQKVRRLTSDYDIPTLPEPFQWEVGMNGVLAMAHYNSQDYEQGQLYEGKMERGIKKMVDWSRPMGMSRMKVPPRRGGLRGFNMDYDALDNTGTP